MLMQGTHTTLNLIAFFVWTKEFTSRSSGGEARMESSSEIGN
jgi:hypothetical protein